MAKKNFTQTKESLTDAMAATHSVVSKQVETEIEKLKMATGIVETKSRLTVDLPKGLMKRLKAYSVQNDMTIREVVISLLEKEV